MGEPSEAASGADYATEARDAVAQVRDTAKWIVGIFGALGAVLVAGTQFGGIGALGEGSARLPPAVTAATLGLLCVGMILWSAVRVLVAGESRIVDLAREEAEWIDKGKPRSGLIHGSVRYPEINYVHDVNALGDFNKIAELRDEITKIEEQRANALEAYAEAQSPEPPVSLEARAALKQRYDDANEYTKRRTPIVNAAQRRVLWAAKYARVRRQFERTARAMFCFGTAGAFAVGVFAWAVNPPDPPDPAGPGAEFVMPTEGWVSLTAEGRAAHRDSLGDNCVGGPVRVVVLGLEDGRADVVSVREGGCATARFTVEGSAGSVRPVAAVDLSRQPDRP